LKLFYKKYTYELELEKETKLGIFIPFIIRSVLGKFLRQFSCIKEPDTKCLVCSEKFVCPYSLCFETFIDKDLEVLKGRQKAPHPFVINSPCLPGHVTNKIKFDLILFQTHLKHYPFIHRSIEMSSRAGLFSERTKFKILSVTSNGRNVRHDDLSSYSEPLSSWAFDRTEVRNSVRAIRLDMRTPLILQKNNRIVKNPDYFDILYAADRRAKILLDIYGDGYEWVDLADIEQEKLMNAEYFEESYERYSASQEKRLSFNGVKGKMTVVGTFTNKELSLLQFAEYFNIGKNTSMGLGSIDFSEHRLIKKKINK